MDDSLRAQFEAINGRFLETKKAVRERDRLLSLMASLDKSLAVEREKLVDLTTQLAVAKERVEELEGLTWTAVWQKLIGNHEEELSEEAERFAALKMAYDASEIKIQSIQNSLQEFEAALVDLAECDEELTAVQVEQQAFLVGNGRLPAEKIHQLNQAIGEGQIFLREAAEAIETGEKALEALTELRSRLAEAKKATVFRPAGRSGSLMHILGGSRTIFLTGTSLTSYFGMGAIVMATGEIQPLLDLFQMELYDVEYQMVPPPDLAVPAYGEVMLEIKSLHQHNEAQRTQRIEAWRIHLAKLEKRVWQKVAFLRNKFGHRETAVAQARTELQTLIEQHWQEANRE